MESATQFRLIFGMTLQIAQLMSTMSKLTFITIFAFASFLEWTTQFRLVAIVIIVSYFVVNNDYYLITTMRNEVDLP
jgi:hypothetical protein